MKKGIKSLALVGSLLAICSTAQAASTAQVTLTSPTIIKQGCERIGAYTVTFDPGTVLTEGDWFYMDLPNNVSICNPIDYMIAFGRTPGNTDQTITYPSLGGTPDVLTATGASRRPTFGELTDNVDLGLFLSPIPSLAPGDTQGPLTNNILSGTGAGLVNSGNGIVLRVSAPAKGRRVTVYVYGTDPVQIDSLTVPNTPTGSSSLTLHLLDGQRYTGSIVLNNPGVTSSGTPSLPNVWGDATTDDIGLIKGLEYTPTAHKVPNVEDTLCVNAEKMTGEMMYVGFDSMNNFLTFTGDPVIAHVGAAETLTLESCGAGKTAKLLRGNIPIAGQQDASCMFDYESSFFKKLPPPGPVLTGVKVKDFGYCPTSDANPFSGNRMLIKGINTFGLPGDYYDMDLTVGSTAAAGGVYWGSTGAWIQAYTPANHDLAYDCETDSFPFSPPPPMPTPVLIVSPGGSGTVIPATFVIGTPGTSAFDDASCAVSADHRVTTITTGTAGAIGHIETFDTLFVDMPHMVYDKNTIGAGVEVDVTLTLRRYPCSTIFTASRIIGTFVSYCETDMGKTTLLFPFLPPMDGSAAGWWAGLTIVNASSTAGNCTLNFTDADGDTATYNTPTIAAGGQWIGGAISALLPNLTPGTGNVGDANVSVLAYCAFNRGGGFAFTGNGQEGSGYTAYVLDNYGKWQ